jgi:hypothetical protein
MADWFSNIAKQAMQVVDNFADTLVEQANAAQDQIAAEQRKVAEEASRQKGAAATETETRLPWETDDVSKASLSQDLMEKVLSLSLTEQNFSVEPPNVSLLPFTFSNVVPIAMKLLEIDTNLGRMHAKLSPKMGEEVFWQYYFFRIEYLKASVGLSSHKPTIIVTLKKIKYDDIIFKPTFVPPPPPPKEEPKAAAAAATTTTTTTKPTTTTTAATKTASATSAATASKLATPGKASKVAVSPVKSSTASTSSTPVKSPAGVSKVAAAAAATDDSDAWDDFDVDLDDEEDEKDKLKKNEEEKKNQEANAKLTKAVQKELDVSDLDLGDLGKLR